MANYKDIKGFKVQSFSADPIPSVAGWTAGGNYPSSEPGSAGAGTQTAALGTAPPGYSANSYEYDGTSWTSGGSMSQPRGQAQSNMTGTQTAALIVGGRYNPAPTFGLVKTEEYNGSSWSNGGDYPEQLRNANNMGTQTAAVNAGGNSANPSVATNNTNHYNGSSWTSASNNSTARFDTALFGLQTAGVMAGGFDKNPGTNVFHNATEEYDGSSWTSGGNLPAATNAAAASGTLTAGIMFGGSQPSAPGVVGTTIAYNGTSWSSLPATLSAARSGHGSARSGTQTLTLAWTGSTPPATNSTEEYVDNSPYAAQTVLNVGQVFYNTTSKEFKYTGANMVGTFASGGSLPAARSSAPGCGIQTASLVAGGFRTDSSPPAGNVKADSYEYNGSSWTAGGTMGTAQYRGSAAGTQTAAFVASGRVYSPTVAAKPATEEYDGSSWTSGGALSTARYVSAQGGTLTAGLVAGGQSAPPNAFANTEEYDGSSWTSGGDLSAARAGITGTGTQTAGLAFTGHTAGNPTTYVTTTEEYNGTSWSSSGAVNQSGKFRAGFGIQTAAVAAGGFNSSNLTATENYDGTSWTSNSNGLPTATNNINNAGVGTQAAGLIAGGANPDETDQVVEYTGADVATIKTVTTS